MDEIWNIGLFLQIAIINNIKDVCEKIYSSQLQKYKVEEIAETEEITENEEIAEEADDDAEAPEIDVMSGIVGGDEEETPKKPARKTSARKQTERRKAK